nr:GTPase RsgA [Streptococcus equi]
MGQTGVGKSTLLNRIAPELALETGDISDSLGRGRHTTRAVSFYDAYNGKIADTPGFSSLTMALIMLRISTKPFQSLDALAIAANFAPVLILMSPSVAVKEALENGELWSVRYQNYLNF